jgi:hypothetical protein
MINIRTLWWILPIAVILSLLIWRPAGAAQTSPDLPEKTADPGSSGSLPDTGQDSCFDNQGEIPCPSSNSDFYGQDASYESNPPGFFDHGDGTVSDLNTGLMWAQDYSGKMTWAEAQSGAEDFNLAGYDDWRLPTVKELFSLMDFSGIEPPPEWTGSTEGFLPFIDTSYFNFAYGDTSSGERIIDAQYWSSTEYVSTTMNNLHTVFGVNFADGRIKGYPTVMGNGTERLQYVRYVRGDSGYGENAFLDNTDGTITDLSTGLMWMQMDSGTGMNWEDALTYCESLSLSGYSDWRLPDAKELQNIVDYTRSPDTTDSPAIDPLFQTTSIVDEGGETSYPYFWTGTTHLNAGPNPGGSAVYIAFGEALGWMQMPNGTRTLMDVHGAGAQRSDPKSGDPADYPYGHGPQGDVVRIHNFVRCVRTVDGSEPGTIYDHFLPLLLSDDEAATSGAILYAPLGETTTYLIDEVGEILHTWESAYRPGNAVYLLENGHILRTGNSQSPYFNAGGAGGIVEEISPEGTVVWSFTRDSADYRLHHDIEPLPNGNILMITWELISETEALAAGRDPDLLNDGELWVDAVIEVDPDTNTIVWEWRLWDHLIQDQDPDKANYGTVADHPERVDLNYCGPGARPGDADWTHINAIDYNPDLDQILLSVRNFSEIWVIDHSTTTLEAAGTSGGSTGMGGDLLYRWGNPQAYDSGSPEDQQLFVQHDAQWIENGLSGYGNILIFNNGLENLRRGYSSIDEITPPLTADGIYTLPQSGEAFTPDEPAWSYNSNPPADFFAENISGAQRLPDGNTLICDGPAGHLFIVNAAGELLWSFDTSGALFRASFYPADFTGIQAIDLPVGNH